MFIISFSKDLFTTRQNILNEIVNYFVMAPAMYVIGIRVRLHKAMDLYKRKLGHWSDKGRW